MGRRGTADGSRLHGWDRVRAQDRARRPFTPARTPVDDLELRAWLRRHDGTLAAPTDARPYWTVRRHGQYIAAGKTPARAMLKARDLL